MIPLLRYIKHLRPRVPVYEFTDTSDMHEAQLIHSTYHKNLDNATQYEYCTLKFYFPYANKPSTYLANLYVLNRKDIFIHC